MRGLSPALRTSLALHGAGAAALVAAPQDWPWVLGGLAADHAALGLAGMWPRSRVLGPNLTRLPEAAARRGEVALTFDDGPDPLVTPRVLDLLDRHDARASFFCIGRRAVAYPALVREIVRRGHAVENHTDRHPPAFACLGPAGLAREIGRAQATLTALAGTPPAFFRAPMGLRNPLLDPVLARLGLRLVSWTRRGLDVGARDPARVRRRLTRGLAAGDVLLLHDGARPRTRAGALLVPEVLAELLAAIAAAGLTPVPLRQAVAPEPVREAAPQARPAAPGRPAPGAYASR